MHVPSALRADYSASDTQKVNKIYECYDVEDVKDIPGGRHLLLPDLLFDPL